MEPAAGPWAASKAQSQAASGRTERAAPGEAGGLSLPGPTSGNVRAAGRPATLLGRGQLERGLVAAPVEFGVNVRGCEQVCLCVRERSSV